MTTETIAKRSNGAIARPLKTLVPLIKSEIKLGFQAGERHWLAVGRLFNEARGHFPASGPSDKGFTFHEWVQENFIHPMTGKPVSEDTAQRWMLAARKQLSSPRSRGELSVDALLDNRSPKHKEYVPEADWKKEVRKVQQTINLEALAERWDDEKKEEKELRALALKIIAAGYRALSAVVHPDKPGGSTEAMAKLTKAKKWLEEAIEV